MVESDAGVMGKLAAIQRASAGFEQARINLQKDVKASSLLEKSPKVRFAIERGRQALHENINSDIVPDTANEAIELASNFTQEAEKYSNEDK